MTDAAAYDGETGELHSVDLVKCIALPELHLAIACTGPALLGHYLAGRIEGEFDTFDDFVGRGEVLLPGMFEDYAYDNCGGDALSNFYVGGWHRHATPRPAAYCMNLWTDDCSRLAQVTENSSTDGRYQRFKFEEVALAGTPIPGSDLITAAGLRIPADVNEIRPDLDLLHLIEVARHEKIEGHHWVGGKAVLTSIDASCVTQTTIHVWEEDVVGDPITPLPIDWAAWRAARLQHTNVQRRLPGTMAA
jgi:hypothetical protein